MSIRNLYCVHSAGLYFLKCYKTFIAASLRSLPFDEKEDDKVSQRGDEFVLRGEHTLLFCFSLSVTVVNK